MTAEYEVIVVGSGAGGATLARELGKRGVSVLVVETGVREQQVGRFREAVGYYDASKLLKTPRTSEEGVILWRTLMAGGSTVVSAGNAIRADERGLREHGIDLTDEYAEAEAEMGVEPVDEALLSEASRRLRDAAADLGYAFEPMPKFVDQEQCRRCGHCTLGCMAEAKWTALDYLDEAVQYGVDVRYAAEVREVLVEDGTAVGVRGVDRDGTFEVRADTVVLAAGALATPRILQQSGVEAGDGLFVDLFVNVYGVTPELVNQQAEPQMALLADAFHDEGFLLSPYLNVPREVRFIEAGVRGAVLPLPARSASW
ncbi:FAD-dependent oxidoreductase [Halobacteriaceae archaeon GCM10025711]